MSLTTTYTFFHLHRMFERFCSRFYPTLIIYRRSYASPIRITTSGNASLFHGVPDWVYEEEIFSSNFALWWSPDSKKLAFLAFDETAVDEYNFPVYNPTSDSKTVVPYTTDVVMKYPKPGYNNPLVSVHVFDLARYLEGSATDFPVADFTHELYWSDRHPANNSIIGEVAWVGNASLILKEVNRNADDGHVILFNLDDVNIQARARGELVRKLGKNGEEADDGWIDHVSNRRLVYAHVEIYVILGTKYQTTAFWLPVRTNYWISGYHPL